MAGGPRLPWPTVGHLQALEELFRAAPVGLAVFDEQLRYRWINPRLAEMNGIPPQEHIDRPLDEVLADLGPTVAPLFREVMESGEPLVDWEIQGATPAAPGVARTWLENVYPLHDEHGEVVGVAALVQEITEQVRERRRADQAEAEVE